MKQLLDKGLQATEVLFAVVHPLFAHVWAVAQVLSNHEQQAAQEVHERCERELTRMREHAEQHQVSREALSHFLKVTQSYGPHLFCCYQVADVPKTNNDLEQAFGAVRQRERRATGRKGAVPALVVRGAVRLTAALATRLRLFSAEDLIPSNLAHWRQIRAEIAFRQEARCKQLRFRKDPLAYLAGLEKQLSKTSLRS
ncbi:hypothetical protein KSC_093240 [Ktedonobacter sp. SOSP1-52]|nr:hypothetical protein KSC_093240 [Ktedonobacter sp. SOSP1-52]